MHKSENKEYHDFEKKKILKIVYSVIIAFAALTLIVSLVFTVLTKDLSYVVNTMEILTIAIGLPIFIMTLSKEKR